MEELFEDKQNVANRKFEMKEVFGWKKQRLKKKNRNGRVFEF
jgi:hypothetical protein